MRNFFHYEYPKVGYFKGSVFVTAEAENFWRVRWYHYIFSSAFLYYLPDFLSESKFLDDVPHIARCFDRTTNWVSGILMACNSSSSEVQGQWPKIWYPFWPNQTSWVGDVSSKPTITQRNLCISSPMLHLSSPLPLIVSKNPSTRNARTRKLRFRCVKFLIPPTRF